MTRKISGYAAVFYKPGRPTTEFWLGDNVVERVARGAFDNSLDSGNTVLAMFNHDPNQLLGKTTAGTMRLEVDNVGLRYEILLPNNVIGDTVLESVTRGDLDGSSFAFTIVKQKFVEERRGNTTVLVRTLLEVDLHECGPVAIPAYAATTTGVCV